MSSDTRISIKKVKYNTLDISLETLFLYTVEASFIKYPLKNSKLIMASY